MATSFFSQNMASEAKRQKVSDVNDLKTFKDFKVSKVLAEDSDSMGGFPSGPVYHKIGPPNRCISLFLGARSALAARRMAAL